MNLIMLTRIISVFFFRNTTLNELKDCVDFVLHFIYICCSFVVEHLLFI